MSPLPELASCLAGLQKRLLPCLKYLVSQETLANGDKIQALMNLVDKPAAQEAPVFEDADLYYWAHLVLDPLSMAQTGLDLLPPLLEFNLCNNNSRCYNLIQGWRAKKGDFLLSSSSTLALATLSSCLSHCYVIRTFETALHNQNTL